MSGTLRPTQVSTRNAMFQEWQALRTNRTKRQRTRSLLVQGVRPISQAVQHGWPIRTLLHPGRQRLSDWAQQVIDTHQEAERVELSPELMKELDDKDDGKPAELLAVVAMPPDRLERISVDSSPALVVVFDRPSSPGNIGTLARSCDAFAADGLVITGHAADPYDPKAVRASTGSVFAVPIVRAGSAQEVEGWARTAGLRIVGSDETGTQDIDRADLTAPTLLIVGNETAGMSAGWRGACDEVVRIPIGGAASSLNAATAATVVLYEAARQRRAR